MTPPPPPYWYQRPRLPAALDAVLVHSAITVGHAETHVKSHRAPLPTHRRQHDPASPVSDVTRRPQHGHTRAAPTAPALDPGVPVAVPAAAGQQRPGVQAGGLAEGEARATASDAARRRQSGRVVVLECSAGDVRGGCVARAGGMVRGDRTPCTRAPRRRSQWHQRRDAGPNGNTGDGPDARAAPAARAAARQPSCAPYCCKYPVPYPCADTSAESPCCPCRRPIAPPGRGSRPPAAAGTRP